ncbi:hypothetical protein ROA7450_02263 [Roseovarius albus]|uniref:Phage tail assembly chaperone n=1 Tax=Roseovarius albus TaxID=1247867 RepID=A0A1X6ZAZ3_9RHOB|nr:rcc01693 family protein [Roseovarius albus]SLN46167.1 hypothetical protein ROA7450_02263 [Roseovarius albus]
MGGFDWPVLLQTGLRGLGLKPAEFWALTPAEFQLMLGAGSGAMPLRRAGLDALSQRYPDAEEVKDD